MYKDTQLLPVLKPVGMTPLQLIEVVRQKNLHLLNIKISYAGRLDPMAEGVMLLVVGDQTKKKDILELDKTYIFDMLLGVETDTYDLLGLVKSSNEFTESSLEEKNVVAAALQQIGKIQQPYPPYSSRTVHGKPLFWYARNNLISTIQVPTKDVEIFSMKYLAKQALSLTEVKETIYKRIERVEGDFRQEAILADWNSQLSKTSRHIFTIYSFQVHCSSGTYIRSLVHRIGKQLHTGAVAWNIRRTTIGDYTEADVVVHI